MIPEVTHEEYLAEIKRIANGEPGWSQIPFRRPAAVVAKTSREEPASIGVAWDFNA